MKLRAKNAKSPIICIFRELLKPRTARFRPPPPPFTVRGAPLRSNKWKNTSQPGKGYPNQDETSGGGSKYQRPEAAARRIADRRSRTVHGSRTIPACNTNTRLEEHSLQQEIEGGNFPQAVARNAPRASPRGRSLGASHL